MSIAHGYNFLRVGEQRITVASGNTLSTGRVKFDYPVKFLVIAVVDGDESGLPATPTVSLRVGAQQSPIYLTGAANTPLQVVAVNTSPWVWPVELPAPLNDFEIQISAVTTADVKFQVSGYGPANV